MTLAAFLRHLGLAAALILVSAAVVRLMISVRIMDTPETRKLHVKPTPKGGGVGVVVTFLLGIAVLYRYGEFARLADPYFRGVIEASVAIAVVSFLDDLYDWPFSIKLTAQLAAALVAVTSGLYVSDPHVPWRGAWALGWIGAAASLAWIIFTTNAMNFIDGMNGLAGGVSLIACLFIVFIAEQHGGWFAYAAAGLLACGLAGFLPFNFPRARIFMGDVGSQFCGFILAMLAIVASRFDGVELSFLLMPMLLSGVLFDVAFTLVRRVLQHEPIARPHRGHLYQVAQRSGMSPVAVTLLHWGFAVYGGCCSLVFVSSPAMWKPAVLLLVVPPQVVWATWVTRRARAVTLGRWG
ncbi:MAG TPA: MraY family glycosyltransferase [Rhodopila sp.]|uniref:glycosyltransferase family 4 protein n=1 Tax=Rhodopila sp. TaxID=2480087 RepID=UPI002BC4E499|nr:MraY family glycosyltransferase [Rhodopila sp.]HVY15176.1 MraY family glycosyltransferase [Rhodopila sp.]